MSDWWQDESTDIGESYSEECGIGRWHARQVDGQWEYAEVHWHFGRGAVGTALRDGELISDDDPRWS